MLGWIRTYIFFGAGVVLTAYTSASLVVEAKTRNRPERLHALFVQWSHVWFRMGNVEFTIEGAQLDPSRNYVIVSNHQSNFDIMANFLAVPVPIRFMAKKELYRFPILGSALKSTGMVKVDRGRRDANILAQLNAQANANLKAATSLMVYPEGTRSKTGELAPFKRGAFAIAINEQMPLVVVTVAGSYKAWPPRSVVRGGPIVARVHEPIETVGMAANDIPTLTARAREMITADLVELEPVG